MTDWKVFITGATRPPSSTCSVCTARGLRLDRAHNDPFQSKGSNPGDTGSS